MRHIACVTACITPFLIQLMPSDSPFSQIIVFQKIQTSLQSSPQSSSPSSSSSQFPAEFAAGHPARRHRDSPKTSKRDLPNNAKVGGHESHSSNGFDDAQGSHGQVESSKVAKQDSHNANDVSVKKAVADSIDVQHRSADAALDVPSHTVHNGHMPHNDHMTPALRSDAEGAAASRRECVAYFAAVVADSVIKQHVGRLMGTMARSHDSNVNEDSDTDYLDVWCDVICQQLMDERLLSRDAIQSMQRAGRDGIVRSVSAALKHTVAQGEGQGVKGSQALEKMLQVADSTPLVDFLLSGVMRGLQAAAGNCMMKHTVH